MPACAAGAQSRRRADQGRAHRALARGLLDPARIPRRSRGAAGARALRHLPLRRRGAVGEQGRSRRAVDRGRAGRRLDRLSPQALLHRQPRRGGRRPRPGRARRRADRGAASPRLRAAADALRAAEDRDLRPPRRGLRPRLRARRPLQPRLWRACRARRRRDRRRGCAALASRAGGAPAGASVRSRLRGVRRRDPRRRRRLLDHGADRRPQRAAEPCRDRRAVARADGVSAHRAGHRDGVVPPGLVRELAAPALDRLRRQHHARVPAHHRDRARRRRRRPPVDAPFRLRARLAGLCRRRQGGGAFRRRRAPPPDPHARPQRRARRALGRPRRAAIWRARLCRRLRARPEGARRGGRRRHRLGRRRLPRRLGHRPLRDGVVAC